MKILPASFVFRRSNSRGPHKTGLHPTLGLERLEERIVLAAPSADDDFFSVVGGQTLNIPGPGVLHNDFDVDGDALAAVRVSDAENGTALLDADGSFVYMPDDDFTGEDTFTYRAHSQPPIEFAVSRAQSSIVMAVDLDTSFGDDSDSDNSSISGTATVRLDPTSEPLDEFHMTDLQLNLADGVSLSFCLQTFFGACIAGLDVTANPDGLHLQMEQAGPSTTVAGNGSFTQTGNDLRVSGTASLDGTGLVDGQIPEGEMPFDTAGVVTDLSGTITQTGQVLTLHVPIQFADVFDLDGNGTATVNLSGTIVATAPVPSGPEQSNLATVTIDVTPPLNNPPDTPGSVVVTEVASEAAVVSWGASIDPDGDSVTYEVQYRKEDLSDSWSSALVTSATSLIMTGLQRDTSYRVRVRATDGQAASSWVVATRLFTTLPYVPTFEMGEFGTLTNVTDVAQTVVLTGSYLNPVVFAQSASTNGQAAVVVRVANLQADRFSIYIAESSAGDGTHKSESVTYAVLEAGTHWLADGTRLEVGKVTTGATVGRMIDNQWETVGLTEGFFTNAPPVVFTQIQTAAGDAFLATRQNNLTSSSFDVALEPEEDNTSQHAAETVGYLAIEEGTHAVGGILLEARYTPASVTQDWYALAFDRQYGSAPGLLSSLASYEGSDNAHVRYQNLAGGSVELKIGEDTSFDTETSHKAESVAYLAIGGSGTLQATVAQFEIGQFGVITDLTDQVQTVLLDRSFNFPVVFAQSPTANGGQPVVVRVNNVLSDRFDIYLAEPSNEDGTHGAETVTYLVLEAGEHQLADGTRLEVGTRTTGASVGQLVDGQWESVTYGNPFDASPVVLTQIQTVSGVPYLQTRQDNVGASGFKTALQQEEAIATQHVPETVGYLAIDSGAGVWSGHVFETSTTPTVVAEAWATVDFGRRFPAVPALLTSLNSYFGRDSAHLRYSNLSDEDVQLLVGEDTTFDTELVHAAEKVGYLAMEGIGRLTANAPLTPPVVTGVVRDGGADTHDTLDSVAVTFDQSVTVAAGDLMLRNDSAGGMLVNLTDSAFQYDPSTRTAVWDFAGVGGIAPAYYTATLDAAAITNGVGVPLDGNGDGVSGGDYNTIQLVARRGDVDLDANVGITDFNTLAMSFDPLGNQPGNDWSKGNFDGDADIDISDFVALVKNFDPLGYAVRAALNVDAARRFEFASREAPHGIETPHQLSFGDSAGLVTGGPVSDERPVMAQIRLPGPAFSRMISRESARDVVQDDSIGTRHSARSRHDLVDKALSDVCGWFGSADWG